MKNIISKFLTVIGLGAALLGCTRIEEIEEDIRLDRCLAPTDFVAKVDIATGNCVEFSWSLSKGADAFILEIYKDGELYGNALRVLPKEVPYTVELDPDLDYTARVKAYDSSGLIGESKWTDLEDVIETYSIKPSVNPVLTDRTINSITVKWDADNEVDHLRLTPALEEDKSYTKIELSGADIEAASYCVSGLKASTNYTVAVYYKRAARGQVSAWTRPVVDGATSVADTASLKQALRDGAPVILLACADSAYVIGSVTLAGPLTFYGEESVDGSTKPTIAGCFNINSSVTSLHLESLNISGEACDGMSQQGHLLSVTEVVESISSIEIVNCEVYGYSKGIYSDNKGASVGTIDFNNNIIHDIDGNGGDGFDCRQSCTIDKITFTNNTIYNGFRTLFRIDEAVNLKAFNFCNNTLSNLCSLNDSNNNGLFHIRARAKGGADEKELRDNTNDVAKDNLFLNMAEKCLIISKNGMSVLPNLSGNYAYDISDNFLNVSTTATPPVEKITTDSFKEAGNKVLSEDPCTDSRGGKFNVEDAAVTSAKAGDPRWFTPYVPVIEDLTQDVTVPVKTWDFTDSKTFRGKIEQDAVRDGIRFYVKENGLEFVDEGLEFPAAGTLDKSGAPEDCGIGIKVDQPGSVVITTVSADNDQALLAISLDGKAKIALAAGEENYKLVLDGIEKGEEHFVYIYAVASPIIVKTLQWSDDIEREGDKILDTPVLSIDKTAVNYGSGESVTISWNAVDKAGSYDVTFDGKTKNTTDTFYTIAASELTPGTYEVGVVSKPAETDLVRGASEPAYVSFSVNEVLEKIVLEKIWDSEYMKAGVEKYGNGTELNGADFVYGNIGYVVGGGKFKFGIDNAGTADEAARIQLGGTGKAGTKTSLQILVGGKGTLELTARSSGDAARPLAVAIGTEEIGRKDAPAKTEAPAVLSYDVEAADGDLVNIFSASSGINIYSIKWTPKGATPVTTSYKWNFTEMYTSDVKVNDSQIYEYNNGTAEAVSSADKNYVLYLAPNGKDLKNAKLACTADGITYHPLTYGGGAAYMFFKVDKPGTLKVKASNGKDQANHVNCQLGVKLNGEAFGDNVELDYYDLAVAGCRAVEYTWEITSAGEISIVKPSGKNSPYIYEVEFSYTEGGTPEPVAYDTVIDAAGVNGCGYTFQTGKAGVQALTAPDDWTYKDIEFKSLFNIGSADHDGASTTIMYFRKDADMASCAAGTTGLLQNVTCLGEIQEVIVTLASSATKAGSKMKMYENAGSGAEAEVASSSPADKASVHTFTFSEGNNGYFRLNGGSDDLKIVSVELKYKK